MDRLGLEPRTNGLKVHCSTIELRFLKWAHQDLNLGPTDYESGALTTEL